HPAPDSSSCARDDVDVAALRTTALAATSAPVRIHSLTDIDTTGLLTSVLQAKPHEVWIIRPDATSPPSWTDPTPPP
ncbi:hypothetical protein NJ76_15375, partial [Rhodococcus sp. IITR03]